MTAEEAEKVRIIESGIILQLERLGGTLPSGWKNDLKGMPLRVLQDLGQELERLTTLEDAKRAIIKAISDSRHAGERTEELLPPARVSMDL